MTSDTHTNINTVAPDFCNSQNKLPISSICKLSIPQLASDHCPSTYYCVGTRHSHQASQCFVLIPNDAVFSCNSCCPLPCLFVQYDLGLKLLHYVIHNVILLWLKCKSLVINQLSVSMQEGVYFKLSADLQHNIRLCMTTAIIRSLTTLFPWTCLA